MGRRAEYPEELAMRRVFAKRMAQVLAGESRTVVARHLGISTPMLTHYCDGALPGAFVLHALSCYFQKPMEWFVSEEP